MFFRTFSFPKVILFLIYFHHLYIHTFAGPINLPNDNDCEDFDQASTLDGPTGDKSAGMGVEFECMGLEFKPDTSSAALCPADIFPLKGKVVGGRTGTNWKFTGDTTLPGSLSGEYILDGTALKIGDNTVGPAAAAVAADVVSSI